jgi:hypothetical protein
MSRAVKSVGRAIGKVVSGVGDAVKKVAKSKLGKAVLIAAAVYFGGAALSGAMSSTGTAMQGISNAWTSLSTAAGQAAGAMTGVEGASFANAGNALSAGFGGSAATMEAGSLVTQGFAPAAKTAAGAVNPITQAAAPLDPISGNPLMPVTPPAAPPPSGMLANMMSSKYTAPALIQAGTGLIGGAMQAKGQAQQTADERARYNRNIGTRLWG